MDPVDYRVTWTLGGEPFTRHSVADANAFPTGTEHLISGLEPGEVYDVKVRARFDARRSRWSDVVSGAAAAHPAPAQDLAVPQSISAPTPEEPLDYARGHDDPVLSISDAEHFEGGFFGMLFVVEFSAVSSHDVSVTYSTSIEDGDTAEADDFVAATDTITALAGIDFIQFSVALNDDDVYEGDETFTVTLSDAVNATLPLPATATGTILDNESEPTISIADASADEGDELMFEATLSGPAERVVSFSFSTSVESGDTARPLSDFSPVTARRAEFGAGDTVVTVPVLTIDDSSAPVFEDDETFTVTISDPSPYGTILDGVAKGTIVNDDDEPPEGADYVGQTVDSEGSVAVGESWYHGTAVNGRIEYRINARRDVVWYRVILPRGSCYEIDVRGATTWQRGLDGDFPARHAPTGPLTLAHPFIEGLYDADGDYVEGTQDKGYLAYPESTVTLRPRQGGTYYIAVTNRIPFESGTFDLSVIDLGSATLTCTYID